METIEIKLDEDNEVFFNVQVEGTSTGAVNVRMVCESDDFSAVFPGSYTGDGEVKVVVPEMKKNGSFRENKDYLAHLEVMVENRYFIPLKFGVKFKESLKVFAEVSQKTTPPVTESRVVEKKPEVVEVKKTSPSVSAAIVTKKPAPVSSTSTLKETVAKRQSEIFQKLNRKK